MRAACETGEERDNPHCHAVEAAVEKHRASYDEIFVVYADCGTGGQLQTACDRLGVKPDQICFVSTNSWDARAAADFGYKVAWMNRFKVEPDRLPGDFSAVIKGLDELPGLLGLTE